MRKKVKLNIINIKKHIHSFDLEEVDEMYGDGDITFCMNECDDMKCPRNKNRARVGRPHSFAYLKNTECCPNNEKNNLENNEENS